MSHNRWFLRPSSWTEVGDTLKTAVHATRWSSCGLKISDPFPPFYRRMDNVVMASQTHAANNRLRHGTSGARFFFYHIQVSKRCPACQSAEAAVGTRVQKIDAIFFALYLTAPLVTASVLQRVRRGKLNRTSVSFPSNCIAVSSVSDRSGTGESVALMMDTAACFLTLYAHAHEILREVKLGPCPAGSTCWCSCVQ
jgi:hypothetical protein